MLKQLRSIAFSKATSRSLQLARSFASTRTHLKSDEHHHDEHNEHDDHGHGHGPPLSEEESIINKYTVGTLITVLATVGYHQFNESYKSKHEGQSFVSNLKSKTDILNDLDKTYSEYQDRVKKSTELSQLMAYTENRHPGNIMVRVDDVPGRYFPHNSNAEFNTIKDWESLGPRRKPKNPYILD